MKEHNSKMKLFKDSCASSKAKSKGFWSFLKGKKCHNYPAHIVDPDNKNNILTEEIDIKTSLQQHFNSIGKNERIDPSFKSQVSDFVHNIQTNKIASDNMLTLKITRESISEILFGLKSGTAMGYDEIPNEFLKYGGKAMLSSLVDLFTAISDFEQIPSDWQNGIIKPIHISGSLFELDNYRGIPLSSNVYKVFSKVMEEKIVSYLEDDNILGESQGAFRKNRRLEDHVFTLQGICSLQKNRR
jgi:hypothetical protein